MYVHVHVAKLTANMSVFKVQLYRDQEAIVV